MDATRDGRTWRLGSSTDVAWIADATTEGLSITVAIPPIFEVYGTFYMPDRPDVSTVEHERAVVNVLAENTPDQPWWLGFLETGAHDVVFDDAPRVHLYLDWPYVLVEAGPQQALTWRVGHMRDDENGVLPDLFFPTDHSWLVSALWDDTWTCFGGPASILHALQCDPLVQAHQVQPGEDATPPGHERD